MKTNSEGHRAALFGRGEIEIDLADLQSERGYDTFAAYSTTKLANLLFTHGLDPRFEALATVAVHPGMVRTRLGRSLRSPRILTLSVGMRPLALSPRRGAQPIVRLAERADLPSGGHCDRLAPATPSRQARSVTDASLLWEETERLRGPFIALAGSPRNTGNAAAVRSVSVPSRCSASTPRAAARGGKYGSVKQLR